MKDDLVTATLNGIFNNLEEVQKVHPEARRLSLAGAAGKAAVRGGSGHGGLVDDAAYIGQKRH
jgi:hypothetical protein